MKAFAGSGGFRIPDGSVLRPDAAAPRRGFPPSCPDPAVELVGPSDEGPRGSEALPRRMAATLANGAQLGCLLFPEQRLGLGHEVLLGALPMDDMDLVLRPQLQRVDVGPRVPTPPILNPMPPPGR